MRVWSKQTKAGRVGTESGFLLSPNPDTLRGPDISFIKAERNIEVSKKYYDTYPDFVIEVISDSDTSKVVKEKLEDYFAAGTQLIWLIYPSFKQVEAHTPEGTMRIFREDDTPQADLLPGFSCEERDLFDLE
jgi:Uma2 family endonuclease